MKDEEISTLQEMKRVLDPFKATSTKFSGSKYVTLSSVLPALKVWTNIWSLMKATQNQVSRT